MQQIPVFVISLKRASERRRSVCAHLDALGVEYQLIDAVDGALLTEEARRSYLAPGCQLTPGEIGCNLSHLTAWLRIAAGAAPAGLILEDDARLDPRFVKLLRTGLPNYDFDYLFLDVENHAGGRPVAYDVRTRLKLGGPFHAYELSRGGEGTHALIVTRAAAAQRAAYALPMHAPTDVYEPLPFQVRFRSLVGAKGAYLGAESLISWTSRRSESQGRVRFKALRRAPMFYWLRDMLTGRSLHRRREIARMMAKGDLDPHRAWRPLPSGRRLVLDAT